MSKNSGDATQCKNPLCTVVRKGDYLGVREEMQSGDRQPCGHGFLTPLWEAVVSGHVEIAELLLSSGDYDADESHPGRGEGFTPLKELAYQRGKVIMAKLLVAYGADVNAAGDDPTPLYLAVENGNSELAAFLLSQKARLDDPAKLLSLAVNSDRALELIAVLRDYMMLNVRDEAGNNALHWLSGSNHQERATEVAEMLLRFGVPLDQPGYLGFTPLCQAVWMNRTALVSLFLMRGANVHHATNKSAGYQTSLHFACMFHRDAIIRRLLDAGADPNALDGFGATPLSLMRLELLPAVSTMAEHFAHLKFNRMVVNNRNSALLNDHPDLNKLYADCLHELSKTRRALWYMGLAFFLFGLFCIVLFGCFALDSAFDTDCRDFVIRSYASVTSFFVSLKNLMTEWF